jgi:hypothetical protein
VIFCYDIMSTAAPCLFEHIMCVCAGSTHGGRQDDTADRTRPFGAADGGTRTEEGLQIAAARGTDPDAQVCSIPVRDPSQYC